ncbi:MAG TPA: hypothetical protein VKX17_23345 [Planctomycetota bacterium]|nr:hypothetical protein [Planctomycetota bacterium]
MKKQFARMLPLLLIAACLCARTEESVQPKHLLDARAFLAKLDLSKTSYQHGKADVKWDGELESHADCSGFLIALLKHSYGYEDAQYKKWFGSTRPNAARFHDAIAKHEGFTEIERVSDLRAGDVLAIKYKDTTKNSGHMLLAAGPAKKIKASAPLEEGTLQWELPVIDSSETGHGVTDWRHKTGLNGKDHDGLGEGVFRLYTDSDGKIAGYAWSLLSVSSFKSQSENNLVVGRLVGDYKP